MIEVSLKLKKLLFFTIGILLFGLLLYKANLVEIVRSLKIIGYYMYIPFCISMLGYFFHAVSWYTIFYEIDNKVRLFFLYKIKLIGETVNSLIPLGMGAGDPFRALSLRSYFPMVKITASIVVERTMYFFVSIINIYIGLSILFIRIQVPQQIKLVLCGVSVLLAFGF